MTVSFLTAPDPGRPRGPRWRVGVGAVVVLVLIVLALGIGFSAVTSATGSSADVGDVVTAAPSTGAGGRRGQTGAPTAVFVHVLGHVAAPGLYELPAGSRVVDVVAAAGGFTADADQGAVNLARLLVDAEQVVIPAVGETVVEPAAGGGGAGAGGGSGAGTKVDLNTADATDLQTLPGVGPATSSAILEWRRENGRFASVDDLLGVTGIGEKTLERLRDLVTV